MLYRKIFYRKVISHNLKFFGFLFENTSLDERREKVKFLIVGSEFSDEPFQDYVDGKHEIDVAFEKLLERLEAKISVEQKTRVCKEKVIISSK